MKSHNYIFFRLNMGIPRHKYAYLCDGIVIFRVFYSKFDILLSLFTFISTIITLILHFLADLHMCKTRHYGSVFLGQTQSWL